MNFNLKITKTLKKNLKLQQSIKLIKGWTEFWLICPYNPYVEKMSKFHF